MNENVESLILAQLREMRTELARVHVRMDGIDATIRSEFADLNQKVDGVSMILTMLAGHVHAIDERVERLETKVTGA